MMGDDESDWYGFEKNGSEWIATWKYSIKPDRSWWIILVQKVTECIASLRFQYVIWWELMNMIGYKNRMDYNVTIQYRMEWDSLEWNCGLKRIFNVNCWRCWSSVGSVERFLPRAWRSIWSTCRLTGKCCCVVICWSCVWSKNTTSLNYSWIWLYFLMRTTRSTR